MRVTHITGINTVIRNISKSKITLGNAVARGLKKGGIYLLRKSHELVPVQLGGLKANSEVRNIGGSGFNTDIIVAYKQDYATFVHENLDAAHGKVFNVKYARQIEAAAGTSRGTKQGGMFRRGENEQAKFLEQPARTERKAILNIIHREAKVGS